MSVNYIGSPQYFRDHLIAIQKFRNSYAWLDLPEAAQIALIMREGYLLDKVAEG